LVGCVAHRGLLPAVAKAIPLQEALAGGGEDSRSPEILSQLDFQVGSWSDQETFAEVDQRL